MRPFTGLCAVMALALCSPIAVAQVPTWNDVAFATVPGTTGDVTLMIDLYAATSGVGPRPLLVWIHGGGWQGGSHNQVPSFALDLRAHGITVASIGYRLTGDAIFPAQIHDCKGAIRFLRANAATYNIDASRVGVWGSSAGGHLAALVATSAGVSELEGTTGGNLPFAAPVIACATFFGPTDILNMHPDCQAQAPTCTTNHDLPTSPESRLLGVNGTDQGLAWLRANANNPLPPFPEKIHLAGLSNPISHLDLSDPPIFIAHGDVDTNVPFAQSIRLRDAAAALGVEHVFTLVPGAGHGGLLVPTNSAGTAWMAQKLTNTCPCLTDLNCSGTVTADDIFTFLDAWFAQNGQIGPSLSADFNNNNEVSANDIFAFLDAWFAQNGVCGI